VVLAIDTRVRQQRCDGVAQSRPRVGRGVRPISNAVLADACAFTCLEVLELPTGGYELRVMAPDSTERIEHVTSYAELKVRYDFVRAQLRESEWTSPTTGTHLAGSRW
jgi:hypothetical protein